MFMFLGFLLAVGLSSSTADPCCPPEQWQTLAFDLNSLDAHPYYLTIGHDDFTRMEGIYAHIIGVPGIYRQYIKDYNTMTQYEIEMSTNSCTRTTLVESFVTRQDCFDLTMDGVSNIQFHGQATVGIAPNTIPLTSMTYEKDGKTVHAGLGGQGECFPIYEKIQSPPGVHFPNMTLFFYNTESRAPDSDLVTIPDVCR